MPEYFLRYDESAVEAEQVTPDGCLVPGAGGGDGVHVLHLDASATTHNEDVPAIAAKVIAGTPVIAILYKEESAEVYANCVVRSYDSFSYLAFSRTSIDEEDGEVFAAVKAVTLGSNGTISTEYHVL